MVPLLPLVSGVSLAIVFFTFYYVLRYELSLFLRDMSHVSSTKAELVSVFDAGLDAWAAFALFQVLSNLTEIPVIPIPILPEFLSGTFAIASLTFTVSFFGRRRKCDLMVDVLESKSKLDDLIFVCFVLVKAFGLGASVYYFVGWLVAGLSA